MIWHSYGPFELNCDIFATAETNFEVKPLPKARIPIIKLTLQPSPGLPYGMYEAH